MRLLLVPLILILIHPNLIADDKFTIIHTNDLHSYFEGALKEQDGNTVKVGGHSILAKKVKEIKKELLEEGEDFLLLDAGDFYSGTLYHGLAMDSQTSFFPEYEFFDFLKYDAVTLGNHEFDGGDEGFLLLMNKVRKLGNQVSIVSTNFVNTEKLPVQKHKLITLKSGVKIGILGALGPDGCSVSSGSRKRYHFIGYEDDSSKNRWAHLEKLLDLQASELKKRGAKAVVLILHGGTGEDDRLAKRLSNIDVIIAGHTHEIYQKVVKDKVISQAGSYGQSLGVLPLTLKNDGVSLRPPRENAYHYLFSESSPSDVLYEEKIQFYQRRLAQIKARNGIKEISFYNKKYLSREEVGKNFADRIRLELAKELSDIDLYFTALGLIRKPLYPDHNYSSEEIFNILPIGFHGNGQLGYRTVSFYLTKRDLYQLINFLNTYSSFSATATPVFSNNVKIEYRKWGIPFINKVKSITINDNEVEGKVLVATNSFIFNYLDLIKDKTFGLIKIEPIDINGNTLKTPEIHKSEISYLFNSFKN